MWFPSLALVPYPSEICRKSCVFRAGAVSCGVSVVLRQLPLCVVIGWMMGRPLSLDFHLFETATIFITVIVVSVLIQKGKSNWLSGLMLLVAYFIVSAGYFVHVNEPEGEGESSPFGLEIATVDCVFLFLGVARPGLGGSPRRGV